MWANLGLFVLVWETVSVMIAVPLHVLNYLSGVGGFALTAAVALPLAFLLTLWLVRGPLGGLDRLSVPDDLPEQGSR